jgi:two-component system, NtrC family, nitrogen regulation response regulator GlnG
MNEPDRQLIAVVDDDKSIRLVLTRALENAGYKAKAFADAAELMQWLDGESEPSLVITDVRMPGLDGLQLLSRLRAKNPTIPVIVMSAYTDLATTVGAFGGGAFDYLAKPFELDHAMAMVLRALQTVTVTDKPIASTSKSMIGRSPQILEIYRRIGQLSKSSVNVLITGETGTGKELVARAVHAHSPRANLPWIAINTAAIPSELLESELFGHEAGAFSGAVRRQIGRFEQADKSSLFLDEIGDMPMALQTRLLRVLAEGEFYRVGGREPVRVDVRVIAATHQDLHAQASRGTFRADLLHRLDVVRLAVPPLRERVSDIPALAAQFLAEAAREFARHAAEFDAEAMTYLQRFSWPGNVRQLRNLCLRLVAMQTASKFSQENVVAALQESHAILASLDWKSALQSEIAQALSAGMQDLHAQFIEQVERIMFDTALSATNGERARAAQLLGIGRNTLSRKLRDG